MNAIFIVTAIIEFLLLLFFKDIQVSINYTFLLIIINITLVSILLLSKKSKYKFYILASYLLRCLLLFFDLYGRNIFILPNSGGDSEGFYSSALTYSNSKKILSGDLYGGFYSKFLGMILKFIGDNRIFVQYLNVIFAMLSLLLLIKILDLIKIKEEVKELIVFIASIFPINLILSSILLRESLIFYFVSLALYFYVKYCIDNKSTNLVISSLFIIFSSLFHSGMIVILFCILVVEFLNTKSTRNIFINTVIILIVTILLIIFREQIFNKFFRDGELNLGLEKFGQVAESRYLQGIVTNNIIDVIKYGWLKFIYFLASPTPLYWRGLVDIMTFFLDSIFYVIVILKILSTEKLIPKDRKKIYKSLVFALLLTSFIFGVGTSTAGTAMRHRNKLLPIFLIVLAIIENYKLKKNKESKRRKLVENISISKILGYLKKNISLIVLSTILLGAVCFGISKFLITPKYTSNTTMIIGSDLEENSSENVNLSQIQANKALVSTYSEIVKSRGVANKVIENLDLNIGYGEFAGKVSIEPVNDTQIISVKVVDTVPERAMDIANETSMIFKDSITEIMNVDNVQILDKAVLPDEPSSPNVLRNTFIGLILGFVLGLAVALFKELSDTSIKSADDIKENFDIPVLGVLPDKKK